LFHIQKTWIWIFEKITTHLNLCKHNSIQKIKYQEQLKIIYIMSNSMNLILKGLENIYSFASFKQNMKKKCIFKFGCGSKFDMNKYITMCWQILWQHERVLSQLRTWFVTILESPRFQPLNSKMWEYLLIQFIMRHLKCIKLPHLCAISPGVSLESLPYL
jgi:hypothetical protein